MFSINFNIVTILLSRIFHQQFHSPKKVTGSKHLVLGLDYKVDSYEPPN